MGGSAGGMRTGPAAGDPAFRGIDPAALGRLIADVRDASTTIRGWLDGHRPPPGVSAAGYRQAAEVERWATEQLGMLTRRRDYAITHPDHGGSVTAPPPTGPGTGGTGSGGTGSGGTGSGGTGSGRPGTGGSGAGIGDGRGGRPAPPPPGTGGGNGDPRPPGWRRDAVAPPPGSGGPLVPPEEPPASDTGTDPGRPGAADPVTGGPGSADPPARDSGSDAPGTDPPSTGGSGSGVFPDAATAERAAATDARTFLTAADGAGPGEPATDTAWTRLAAHATDPGYAPALCERLAPEGVAGLIVAAGSDPDRLAAVESVLGTGSHHIDMDAAWLRALLSGAAEHDVEAEAMLLLTHAELSDQARAAFERVTR